MVEVDNRRSCVVAAKMMVVGVVSDTSMCSDDQRARSCRSGSVHDLLETPELLLK